MRKRIYTSVSLAITVVIVVAALTWHPRAPQEVEPPEVKNSLYVSLGDSVASGLGLATPGDSSSCGRTKEAYPYLLAEQEGYRLVHLACSGATLAAGINGPQVVAGELASQRERLFQYDPRLITFGIGANDVAWLSLVARCLEVECGTLEDKTSYEGVLEETVKPQLRTALKAINERYGGRAELLVVGYYQVFPPAGSSCEDIAGLDDDGLIWGRELRTRLNKAVAETVKDTGIGTFVEIDFSGHELCTAEPWVQGLADPAAYHANAAGQKAIAEQIAEVLVWQ